MSAPPPFVLVHGGRHGGWCWGRVAPRLRDAGHEVYTPTLTGLGERCHLLRPDIDLATHIQDIVAVFEFEEIADAVLVAHSYGGSVIAGAMEHINDRVRTVVFVDAFMPLSGESVLDVIGTDLAETVLEMADRDGEGWYIPPSDASFYGISDPGDIAWVNSKMTAQPLKTYTDPVGSTDRAWAHPGMFVECQPSTLRPEMLARARKRNAVDARFRYRVLEAPHDAMVTAPGLLAEVLLEAVDLS
jgi:pimeloyl-ACP methyl ester carboxylesterase